MITNVEVFTPRIMDSPLDFDESGRPSTDPIHIRNIDGLGPVIATVNTTQYADVDGEFPNGSSTGKRNIVLTVGLRPNWNDLTIEDLRLILYSYFMPKNAVTLQFESTHMETVAIDGIVESIDPNIFSKTPEFLISIICPKSEFVAISATVVPGATYAIGLGDYDVLTYHGNVPTGFVIDVAPLDASTSDTTNEVRLQFQNGTGTDLFTAIVDMEPTQFHRISTVSGSKFAQKFLLAGGLPVNILGQVVPGSVWRQLMQGDNLYRIMSDNPGQPWTLSYFARYGGL